MKYRSSKLIGLFILMLFQGMLLGSMNDHFLRPLGVTGMQNAFAAQASAIQLPQSGQTTSHAATDDGETRIGKAWPNPRFSDDNNGMISDRLTGLIWAKDANLLKSRDPRFDTDEKWGDGAVKWQHALAYIKKLNTENYLGYSDWRLANLNELASLVNQGEGKTSAWLNAQGFADVQASPYWSSSTNVLTSATAWMVGIDGGLVNYTGKSGVGNVWPVRGGESGAAARSGVDLPKTGQVACYDPYGRTISCAGSGQDAELQMGAAWPQPRFIDNGNQTITDNLTGLIWTRDANLRITRDPSTGVDGNTSDGAVAWQEALDSLKKLNREGYLGFSDWRLPNRNELASMMNYAEPDPFSWLNWQGFFSVQDNYWSSGTVASTTGKAWNVKTTGAILGEYKSSGKSGSFLWPVRGPELVETTENGSIAQSSTIALQGVMSAVASLSVTTASLPAGTVGAAYRETLVAAGGSTPYTWSRKTGSLPAGLTLSSAGVISGSPTIAATSSFTVQVKDKAKRIATRALSITVNTVPPSITTTMLRDGYISSSYSHPLYATGGKKPYTWSVISGALPAGLTLSTTGLFSGNPITAGASNFTVQVKDANLSTFPKSFTL